MHVGNQSRYARSIHKVRLTKDIEPRRLRLIKRFNSMHAIPIPLVKNALFPHFSSRANPASSILSPSG